MVSEIRVYVEGGGDKASGKAAVQEGFSRFLNPLREIARRRRIRWHLIACGPRNAARGAFQIALRQHTDAFNILLVDAEAPVTQSAIAHLRQRDGWNLEDISEEQCHMMVQTMESWLLADKEALSAFYGAEFNVTSLPRREDVEQIDKTDVAQALENATRGTPKREYHKIRHGPRILAQLNPTKVRAAARHCDRLFTTVSNLIGIPI